MVNDSFKFAYEICFFLFNTHRLPTPYKYAVFIRYPDELSRTDSQKTVRKFLLLIHMPSCIRNKVHKVVVDSYFYYTISHTFRCQFGHKYVLVVALVKSKAYSVMITRQT